MPLRVAREHRVLARELLREASLELARLRRIRGASHKTWRRIARARARLACAAALLAAPIAGPAAAADPLLRHPLPPEMPALAGAELNWADPTLADIDGDGDADFFLGEYSGNVRFFENTGTATEARLAAGQLNPLGLADVGSRSELSLADLDGDGDLDALIGTLGTNFTPQVRFFRNTGTATAPAFAAPVTNPFGLATLVTDLADLDGDGDLDALRPSFVGLPGCCLPTGMVFHENTGSASAPAFGPGVTSPFGLAAFAHGFADLDGDGDLDGFDSDYGLIRFENTGSATEPAFAAPLVESAGEVPSQSRFDFADLDGDGDLDGLVTGYDGFAEGHTSLWMEGRDSGAAPAFTSLGNPFGLGSGIDFYGAPAAACSLADLDGDGDLDAYVTRYDLEENFGSPTAPVFAFTSIDALGVSGDDPVLADLDADGDRDALVGLASGDLLFFENSGSASTPGFAAPLSNPFGLASVGTEPAPELGDVDGDGDLDLLIGNAAGELWLLENTGGATSPAFGAAQSDPAGLADVPGNAAPALVDLDGDGDLDALVGASTGTVFFFENTGTAGAPAFSAATESPFGLVDVGSHASPDFADADGDGDLEAFVGRSTGQVLLFRNTGTASAPAFDTSSAGDSGGRTPEALGRFAKPDLPDLDGDGDPDAVIGGEHGVIVYWRNLGAPGFTFFSLVASRNPFGLEAQEPEFVDIDADGDFDLFAGRNFLGTSTSGPNWYENTGSASTPGFGPLMTRPFGLPLLPGAPAFADLDADGDLDLLIGQGDGNLRYFTNTGSASTPAFGASSTNPFGLADVGSYATPALADLDGDGDLDALVGAQDGSTRFFRNTGSATTPAFAGALVNPFGLADVGYRSTPTIADVDGDGDLDVLVGDAHRRVALFENVLVDRDACRDGLDNDGDGVLDVGGDPGCADADDTSELSGRACDNAADDDGDGLRDLSDPGCVDAADASEYSPRSELWSCGLGPELLLLAPLFAAARRRFRSPSGAPQAGAGASASAKRNTSSPSPRSAVTFPPRARRPNSSSSESLSSSSVWMVRAIGRAPKSGS